VLLRFIEVDDLTIFQRFLESVPRSGDVRDAFETKMPAGYHHNKQTEQKPHDIADEHVPPVMPVIYQSGQRAYHRPNAR